MAQISITPCDSPLSGLKIVESRTPEITISAGVGPKGPKGDTGERGPAGLQGVPGQDGQPGRDGQDGAPGQDGQDGFSPTVNITPITGGHRITITDADGAHSADVMDGEDGQGIPTGGAAGQVLAKTSGTAYDVVWQDRTPTESVSGTTPTINALPGIRYICGEVSTLDITLPASGCVDVTFVSGSTPTVLTVTPPTGQTLKWANGFDPDNLEADTTYEINIADGCLGVTGQWS